MKVYKIAAICLCVTAVFLSGCDSGRKEKNDISTNVSVNNNATHKNEANKPERTPEHTAKSTLPSADHETPTDMYISGPTENKTPSKVTGTAKVTPTAKATIEANATPTAKMTMAPAKTAEPTGVKTPVRTSTPSSTIKSTPAPTPTAVPDRTPEIPTKAPETPTKTPETTTQPPETPKKPPETTTIPQETPTKTPEFDINYWIEFAKQYAVSIGLKLDETAIYNWDNPIRANAKCKNLERDIKNRLDRYARNPEFTDVWIWMEEISPNDYNLFIGYA